LYDCYEREKLDGFKTGGNKMRSLILVPIAILTMIPFLFLTSCEDKIDIIVPEGAEDHCLDTYLNFDLSLISQEARGVEDTTTINLKIRFLFDNGECIFILPEEPISIETGIDIAKHIKKVYAVVDCPYPGVTVGFEQNSYLSEPLEMKIGPVETFPFD
jgi:hypothetical protein